MRVVFALLALVAMASAAAYTIDGTTLGASLITVNGVQATETGGTSAVTGVVGGYFVVDTSITWVAGNDLAGITLSFAKACDTAAPVSDANNQIVGFLENAGNKLQILLKAPTVAFVANDVGLMCASTGGANAVTPTAYLNTIKDAAAATAIVTTVTKVGDGPFIYGDKVKYGNPTTDIPVNTVLSLGAALPDSTAATLGMHGGVIVATAGATVDGATYMGAASDQALKPYAATGGIETFGQVSAAGTIAYLAQTSTATLMKVDGMTMPKANYTSGSMIDFELMANNTVQGPWFHIVALKGAGDKAACDAATKFIVAKSGVKSMKWLVPNVTAKEDWSVWVKSANQTIACTAQAGWTLSLVPPPKPVTPAPAPVAPAPAPVAPAPAAASTTGTSSASAVRGGLLAAFACVLAGLGVSAAF